MVVRDAATNTESCEDTALSSLSNLCEISSVTNAVAAIEKVVETTPYKPPELLSISTVASPASTAAPQATAPAVPPAASCSAKDVSETVVALDGFVRTTVNAANRLPDVIQSTSTSNVEDGYTTDKALLRTDWQLPEAQKEPSDSNLVDDEEYIDDFEDEEDENTTIDMREERDQRRKTNKVELHRTCVVETMQESRVHRSTFAKEKERNITRNDKEAESNVYMQVAFQQNGDAIGEAAASDGYAADGGFSFFKRRAEALIRSATAAAAVLRMQRQKKSRKPWILRAQLHSKCHGHLLKTRLLFPLVTWCKSCPQARSVLSVRRLGQRRRPRRRHEAIRQMKSRRLRLLLARHEAKCSNLSTQREGGAVDFGGTCRVTAISRKTMK